MGIAARTSKDPTFLRDLIYGSYLSVVNELHGLDSSTRDISIAGELLDRLDVHLDNWPRVTIAGSKGKGSTAVLLASILAAGGERVGLITSPHLRRFNERIRIDGRCISDDQLGSVADQIAPAVRAVASRTPRPRYLGPGGVILALAAKAFESAGVSVLVIEAGRGGACDEARLAKANVSVLTPVMLEHRDKLGATLEEIAEAKIRITAPGSVIITSSQQRSVWPVLKRIARENGSPIRAVNSDITIEKEELGPRGIVCDMRLENVFLPNLCMELRGPYQSQNLAAAILAARELEGFGIPFSTQRVYLGIRQVRWPGRCQMLQQNPWVLLDGAINGASAHHACSIVRQHAARHTTAVISVPKPKDLAGVCREAARIADKLITTEVPVPSLKWYQDAARIASRYSTNVKHIPQANDAFKHALDEANPDDGIVLFGTQSFIGAALDFWNVDTCGVW